MIKFFQYTLLIVVLSIAISFSSIEIAASAIFFPVAILCFLGMAEGRLSIISLFTFAFAYMILPEAILNEDWLIVQWGKNNVVTGFRVSVLSFVAVYVGFILFRKRSYLPPPQILLNRVRYSANRFAWCIFFILTVILCVLFSPMIIHGITSGRGSLGEAKLLFDVGVIGYFLSTLVYVTCGFWGYYYACENKGFFSIAKALLLSSPLLLIGLASGTRFFLCFMLVIILTPWIYHLSWKKVKWLVFGVFGIAFVFSAMRASRGEGFDIGSGMNMFLLKSDGGGVFKEIASMGSVEGLLRSLAMINEYTATHAYTYGKSIGFLGIFWIPRFLWEGKPVHMGHWLIREYETSGFSDVHSVSASFCGELFLDFGYFCIVLCFLLGWLMAKFDEYIDANLAHRQFFSCVASGMLMGWALFMVRSFVTASQSLLLLIPILFVLNKFVIRDQRKFK